MNTDGHGLLHGKTTDRIIQDFLDVYNELGHGFAESACEKAMEIALTDAGMRVQRQVPIKVFFRGRVAGEFIADLLMEGLVLVELKAARALDPAHEAQLLNYLRAAPIEVGLLMNFGPRPQFKRLIFDNPRKQIRGDPC